MMFGQAGTSMVPSSDFRQYCRSKPSNYHRAKPDLQHHRLVTPAKRVGILGFSGLVVYGFRGLGFPGFHGRGFGAPRVLRFWAHGRGFKAPWV